MQSDTPHAPPGTTVPITTPARMRAVVQPAYGTPDLLHVTETPVPAPGAGEVLVRVHAAGVDRGVWHLMTGRPYLIRLVGFGLRRPKQPVPGLDVAGVVAGTGPGVTGFAEGDEVLGIGMGTFAEYTVAKVAKLAHKPASVSFTHAAALPVSGITALQAVRDQARVRPGQRVLVMGASGGVGSFAVQIAKAAGAEVTGVASAAKADLVRSLGADHVIDYRRDDALDGSRQYDVIIDTGGVRRLSHLRRALTARGTVVLVGGENGGRWTGGFQRQIGASLWSLLSRRTMKPLVSAERGDDIRTLVGMVTEGRVTPAVDRTYPLERAADAVRDLEQGRIRGKAAMEVIA